MRSFGRLSTQRTSARSPVYGNVGEMDTHLVGNGDDDEDEDKDDVDDDDGSGGGNNDGDGGDDDTTTTTTTMRAEAAQDDTTRACQEPSQAMNEYMAMGRKAGTQGEFDP